MRKTFLLLVLVLLLPVMTRAAYINEGGFLLSVGGGEATIFNYTGTYGNVSIPDLIGDTHGNYYVVDVIYHAAFRDNTYLSHVTIPASVTTIADESFKNDTSLKKVTMSTGVTVLAGDTFAHCHSLTNVTMPPGLTFIGDQVFWDCTSLTNIQIGNSVHSIGLQAFLNCTSLKTLTIPNSVNDIQPGAFQYCTNLVNVTIGSGLTYLGQNAFYGCTSLTNVIIGTNVDYIGGGAFYNCSKLKSLIILPRVKRILAATFYGCSNLTRITIPAGVTNIQNQAFDNCISLTNITFLGNAPTYGKGVFDGVPTNAIVFYHYGTSGWGKTYDGLRTRALGVPLLWQTNNFGSLSNAVNITITGSITGFDNIVIPDEINGYPVVGVKGQAFINANMTNVVVPNTVTNIGNSAFANCTNLMSLTFLGNAPDFGTNVFGGLPTGAAIYYLNGMTGWGASYGSLSAAQLTTTSDGFQFTVSNNAASITGYIGAGGNAAISDNLYGYPVTAINDYAFQGSALASVMIPDSVTSIGNYAFSYCYSLTNMTIGSGVTNIGDYAFLYCTGLTNITFAGNAPTLGVNVFANVGFGATIYYLPGSSGWDTTFGGLPASMIVATTPDGFEYATYRDHVEILSYNGLGGAITIPDMIDDQPVSVIDDSVNAFVTSLIIPASVVSIGDNSFTNCVNLTNITFLGDAPALGTNVFTGAAPGATVYYHAGTTGWGMTYGGLPAAELDGPFIYQLNPDGTLTLAGLSTNEFSLELNLPAFVYGSRQPPRAVTRMGNNAFHDLTNLMEVMIPDSITNIGDGAFSGCINLTNITFLGDAPASGTGVFANVGSGATVFYLPGTSGWDTTFDGLPAVMITTTPDGFGFALNEDSTVTITNYTGAGGAVTIPDSIYGHPVTAINDSAFQSSALASVMIPDSVISIGNHAFSYCYSLTNVTIGSGITNIGDFAFVYCTGLTNITFTSNAPALGAGTFANIASGATVYYYYGTSGWDVTFGGLPAVALNGPAIAATFSVPALINNQFQFTVNGTGGSNYVVQAATNLADWISLTTNAAPFQFTETNANTFDQRFYRVKIWP